MRAIDGKIWQWLRGFLADNPHLCLEEGKRHTKIRNRVSEDWLPISGSVGDYRSVKNFQAALRKLAETGHGFIFSKTGHSPRAGC